MIEQWLKYLKDNAPELYDQAEASQQHIYDWRYKQGYDDGFREATNNK